MVTLFGQIEGKIAWSDLWDFWGRSCWQSAMSMISVYEKCKDKGLTIVGVDCENNKKDSLVTTQKNKYPWINLLELNDSQKIREK